MTPTHGFSEVASRANINDLAGGGWQKTGAACRRDPVPGAIHEIIPSRFWRQHADELSQVLASQSLGADLCAYLWEFLERRDYPPESMDVLVIYWADDAPNEPPEMLVGCVP